MKKKFLVSILSLSIIGSISLFSPPSAQAKENPEVIAETVVQQFFDAMANRDFDKATDLVVDPRYKTKEKQIAKYDHYNSVSDFDSMKITSVDAKDEETVTVTFVGKVSGVNSTNELNVKEINNEWKLLLGDDDPATIAAVNAPEFTTTAEVDYYSFTGFNYGRAHYTINSFSTQGNAVNIIGWQYANTQFHADVTYQVAQDTFLGWKTLGNSESVVGNYTSSPGDRFTISLTGVPAGSDYHIRIVNWAPVPVDGAGNVYTN